MPRPLRTVAERWADITQVLMIPDGIYQLINNQYIFCSFCTVNIHHVTETNVRRHYFSQLHLTNSDLQAGDSDPSEAAKEECMSRTHAFYYDLAEAFMSADIPFEKLNNSKLVEFLENNMKRKIPDPSKLRKTYTDLVYERNLQKIRNEVDNHCIYLEVDETNDPLGRLITHAIVASLIADAPGIPRIIYFAEIPEGNAQRIAEFVEQALTKLWPGGIRRQNVLLFISDAAPYMMAAGRLLKTNYHYDRLVHVSCLAHGLHRVAEEIRRTYRLAHDVIAEKKAIFLKSPRRKRLFLQIAPGVPLPPRPIITRWGEWLKAASYYCNNFRQVQAVIEQLEPDAAAVDRAQELWENMGKSESSTRI